MASEDVGVESCCKVSTSPKCWVEIRFPSACAIVRGCWLLLSNGTTNNEASVMANKLPSNTPGKIKRPLRCLERSNGSVRFRVVEAGMTRGSFGLVIVLYCPGWISAGSFIVLRDLLCSFAGDCVTSGSDEENILYLALQRPNFCCARCTRTLYLKKLLVASLYAMK